MRLPETVHQANVAGLSAADQLQSRLIAERRRIRDNQPTMEQIAAIVASVPAEQQLDVYEKLTPHITTVADHVRLGEMIGRIMNAGA